MPIIMIRWLISKLSQSLRKSERGDQWIVSYDVGLSLYSITDADGDKDTAGSGCGDGNTNDVDVTDARKTPARGKFNMITWIIRANFVNSLSAAK